MARKEITAEQWKFARAQWEAEPLMTHAQVGASLGCSKQAVQKKAKADGWQKRISIQQATEQAYEVADAALSLSEAKSEESSAGVLNQAAAVVSGVPLTQPGRTEPLSDFERHSLAQEAAVKKRAEILERHRLEIKAPRGLIIEALKEKSFDKARTAKAAADALKTLQEAERKAWGFDRDGGSSEKPSLLIVRGGKKQ